MFCGNDNRSRFVHLVFGGKDLDDVDECIQADECIQN